MPDLEQEKHRITEETMEAKGSWIGVKAVRIKLLTYLERIISTLPIVEIGCMTGGTTAGLAEYLLILDKPNKIISIDPFEDYEDNQGATGVGDYKKAKANLEGYENVEIIQAFSWDVKPFPVSLLFADGCHGTDTFLKDYRTWHRFVLEFYLFHDYDYLSIQEALCNLGVYWKIAEVPNLGEIRLHV